jgi:hypothetical protein
MDYGAKFDNPKSGEGNIERELGEQGIRKPLAEAIKHHERKAAHVFRKFLKRKQNKLCCHCMHKGLGA